MAVHVLQFVTIRYDLPFRCDWLRLYNFVTNRYDSQSVSSDQISPSIYRKEENTRAKLGRVKRIGILTIRNDIGKS